MKVKQNFILRDVAGMHVAMPLDAAFVNLNGMITLNNSGALLWRLLERGATRDSLVDALLVEYEVTREDAFKDVDSFIAKLDSAHCIEY